MRMKEIEMGEMGRGMVGGRIGSFYMRVGIFVSMYFTLSPPKDHSLRDFFLNCSRYLSDTFDPQNTLHLLPPPASPLRYKTLQWIHASEATFLLHALACLYVQWHQHDGDVEKTLQGLSGNVVKDLDYLESHLQKQEQEQEEEEEEEGGGRFIMGGKNITAADIMMQFSVRFILMRELGTQGVERGRWERVERWLELCEGTESYQRAVERTGFRL